MIGWLRANWDIVAIAFAWLVLGIACGYTWGWWSAVKAHTHG